MTGIWTLRLGLVATCLYLIILSAASPAISLAASEVSAPAESYIVSPKSRDRLEELDKEIRAIIKLGKVDALISEYSSEFKGIVVWFVEAEQGEIEQLKSKVAGVSASKNLQDCYKASQPSNAMLADLTHRLTFKQILKPFRSRTLRSSRLIAPPLLSKILNSISG